MEYIVSFKSMSMLSCLIFESAPPDQEYVGKVMIVSLTENASIGFIISNNQEILIGSSIGKYQ